MGQGMAGRMVDLVVFCKSLMIPHQGHGSFAFSFCGWLPFYHNLRKQQRDGPQIILNLIAVDLPIDFPLRLISILQSIFTS